MASSQDLRVEAERLKAALIVISIQLQADGAQAEQAKADIAVAEATETVGGFLGGTGNGSSGRNRLKLQKMIDSSFLRRRTGQHVLEIRNSGINGNEQALIGSQSDSVYFPPKVEEEAEKFRNRLLLTGPSVENSAEDSPVDGD